MLLVEASLEITSIVSSNSRACGTLVSRFFHISTSAEAFSFETIPEFQHFTFSSALTHQMLASELQVAVHECLLLLLDIW